MGLVYTEDLLPGMITAEDVYTADDQLIIPTNTTLTDKLITRLNYYSITEVIVAGPITSVPAVQEGYSSKIKNSSKFKKFRQRFSKNVDTLESAMKNVLSTSEQINSANLIKQTQELVPTQATSIEIFDMIHNMRTYDDSTYAHSINVALICTIMAKWLNMSKEDSDVLTLCGLLHDIGKLNIPSDILNKPGKLTPEEFELVKSHCIKGYEILKKQQIDERIQLCALQHHERCDGTGYPNKLQSNEMTDFAKIVAIADVYDAMTASRTYRSATCPFKVISVFEEEGLQKYDPQYILTFLERIASSYMNNNVELSDGRIGEVVMINRNKVSKPIVRIGNDYVDLSKHSNLEITSII